MQVNFPLLFFLLVIPLSGFIAWAGDRIGHRIGKRRHTFLNLRPRHTATLTTIAAGMFIAVASFALMWGSNATFRQVLSEGASLYANNRALKRENRRLGAYVAAQRSVADRATEEAKLSRDEAKASLYAKELAVEAQQKAEANLQTAKRQVQNARLVLTRAAENLKATRADLKVTKTQLQDKEQRVALARRDLENAQKRLAYAENAAEMAERKLSLASRDFKVVTARFKEVNAQMEARAAEQQAAYDKQKAELDRLTRETAELEARRARLNTLVSEALVNTTAFRRGRITYKINEELDRASFRPGMTVVEARTALLDLLTRAGTKALARGAALESGRAVIILPKAVSMEDGRATPADRNRASTIVDESASIAAAADAIRDANEDVAVLVVASANAVAGEPVPVEFRTYRNRRVLQKDAVLGRITLDGTQPQQAVADSLYLFLRNSVRKRLRTLGVIPLSPDALTGDDDSLVSISGDRWFQLLDDVRRAGPGAQVVVRAAADLRAADAPDLRFEVTPARDISAARP